MVVSSLDVLSGERGAALTHSHATHFRGDSALTRFGRLQSDAFALKIRRMPLAKTLYERNDASTKILRSFFRYEGSHHLWRAWLKRVRVPTECGESGPPRLAIARSVSRDGYAASAASLVEDSQRKDSDILRRWETPLLSVR